MTQVLYTDSAMPSSFTKRRATAFRFTEREKAMLEQLSEHEDVSQNEVIRILLRQRYREVFQAKDPLEAGPKQS